MRRRNNIGWLLLCLTLAGPVAVAEDHNGSDAVGDTASENSHTQEASSQLQGLLSNIGSFQAGFRQINDSADTVVTGQLWLQKPGKFRILTESFGNQWLISDGASLWNYDEDLEQVVITEAGTNPADIPVLLFASHSADITSAYHVSGYQDEQLAHYLLEPKTDNSLFRSVSVAFAEEVPVFLSIMALNGQATTLEIVQPQINTPLDGALFQFEVPEDVDVLDDRPSLSATE